MHIISPVHTALPKKQAKTKQGRHRDVSTPKLVISITLPTLTQLCFSSAGNLLRRSSLILLHFISLGHKSYFEEKEQGGFKGHHGSYSPILSPRNSLLVWWEGDSQTCKATPGSLTLWRLMFFAKSCPWYPRALPSSKSSTPKKKLQLSDIPRKTIVF